MYRGKIRKALVLALAVFTLLPTWGAFGQGQEKHTIILVTSASADTIQSLTLEEAKAIYLRQLAVLHGKGVIPIQRQINSDIRLAFNRLVMKMDESELKNYWIKKKLAGEEDPPKSFDSLNSLVCMLMKKPGTIGYMEESQLTAELKKKIAVIPLKGENGLLKPTSERYPLRY